VSRAIWTALVLVAVLAAGCGGDDESASEEWVSGLCSAAADWRSSLEDTVSQFQNPSDLTAESLRSAVEDGLDSTETFLDEVRSLGAPETEAGQEASQIVDSMATDVQSTADDLRETFESSGDSLTDLIGKVSAAGTQITQMGQDVRSSLDELQNLEGGDELRDEIDSNEDCDAARAGS
jgi:ABC-type transporter Mla subunit MlaD